MASTKRTSSPSGATSGVQVVTAFPRTASSLSNAALKFKFGDAVTAKGGYTQLYVPGILGVNWSYQPGTYRGGQIEGTFGGLYLTYAIADEYKAPWFKNTTGFSKSSPYASDPFTDANKIDYIHGLAARYTFRERHCRHRRLRSVRRLHGTATTSKLAHKFDVPGA